ncbi:hypothetical protein BpHYR1_052925 [Brachionus plicatilis]|uniref:Uncharacterized protein n=1 Tax=Brachionus plicatilis TaxID=10195 RepID=A0A3M7SA02_BRAPC|nr:hypothetical protein BpHYR1_052925 [Brachionus plicatilis]
MKEIKEINKCKFSNTDKNNLQPFFVRIKDKFGLYKWKITHIQETMELTQKEKRLNLGFTLRVHNANNHSECSAIDQIGHNKSIPKYVHKGMKIKLLESRGKANGRMVRQGQNEGIYYEIPHSFNGMIDFSKSRENTFKAQKGED